MFLSTYSSISTLLKCYCNINFSILNIVNTVINTSYRFLTTVRLFFLSSLVSAYNTNNKKQIWFRFSFTCTLSVDCRKKESDNSNTEINRDESNRSRKIVRDWQICLSVFKLSIAAEQSNCAQVTVLRW